MAYPAPDDEAPQAPAPSAPASGDAAPRHLPARYLLPTTVCVGLLTWAFTPASWTLFPHVAVAGLTVAATVFLFRHIEVA